jgi:sulfite reductase (NADPH) hemoprotein beta-component
MHAIQTSGNCIRNVTADHFAGAAADEIEPTRAPMPKSCANGRPCIPNFQYLPRKFKIAVTGAERDRAAIQTHDIGLHLKKNAEGELGFAVWSAAALAARRWWQEDARLPAEGASALLLEAILRVYNCYGRRDNKYKARIKILVHETGVEEFARQVEAEWADLKDGELLPAQDIAAIDAYFAPPALPPRPEGDRLIKLKRASIRRVLRVARPERHRTHRNPDYAAVTISLKGIGEVPGDASDSQMDAVADIAEALCIRRDPRQPRAEPDPAACGARRPAAVYDRAGRDRLRTPRTRT